jgi:hypothetical protein
MEGVTQGTTNLLNEWGIPGFFILILALVIIYLWRDGKSKDKLIQEIQEKRLQDVLIYTAGIEKFRETNERLIDDFKSTVDQLRLTVEHLRGRK